MFDLFGFTRTATQLYDSEGQYESGKVTKNELRRVQDTTKTNEEPGKAGKPVLQRYDCGY